MAQGIQWNNKLEIRYYRFIISWRILVSFTGFFERFIFACWNIWGSIILLLLILFNANGKATVWQAPCFIFISSHWLKWSESIRCKGKYCCLFLLPWTLGSALIPAPPLFRGRKASGISAFPFVNSKDIKGSQFLMQICVLYYVKFPTPASGKFHLVRHRPNALWI